MRQRLRLRRSPLRFVGRLLVFLFSLALIWYGLMGVLAAAGVAPGVLDGLSGYRSAYDFLAGLEEDDLSSLARTIAGVAGAVVFGVFAYLAFREVPRPRLSRHELELELAESDRGRVSIAPRALERVAESAAAGNAAVSGASGRWGDETLTVDVEVRRSSELREQLEDVQQRVIEALAEHGLPERKVSVTLARFDRPTRRELA